MKDEQIYFLREAERSPSVQCWTTLVTSPFASLMNSTMLPSMLKLFSDIAIKGIFPIPPGSIIRRVGKNLAEKGLVFVKEDHEIRRLNDLHRGANRKAGLRAGRQAIYAVRVVSKTIRASFVKGRRPRLHVLRLEIRYSVEQIVLVDPPNAGKIRLAIRGSRSGGGEVGLAVGCSGHSRSWATRPLRC